MIIQKTCPICGRELVEGHTIDDHHLIPKTHGKRNKQAYDKDNLVTIHVVCHSKIHATFSETELLNYYHTIERLCEHIEIQKFVKWVSKKDPEFMDKNKDTKDRKKKRRR